MAGRDRIDEIDLRILAVLQADGRRPYADVGAAVGISGPSAHERVKKLEARGVIRGSTIVVDPAAIGYGVLAFTWVTQAPGTVAADLTVEFAGIDEIVECHHIAGEADYLLKLRARDTRHLERVLHRIQATPNVFSTRTDVVFSSAFEGRPVPPSLETDGVGAA
jgi:Lrp/AsnC family leucine-responsive transcriptional regulator